MWWCSCGGVLAVVFVWWCLCDKPQEEYAELLTIFTEKASKMIVLCDASDNFHRKSFQNDRFVRGFLQISKKKLPKRLFARCFRQFSRTELPKRASRTMLPTIFTEKTSKMIVSCEASFKFHRNKLPKRAFRTMPPTIFTEKASKMIVSCEASSKFDRTMLPKRAFRAMLPTIFTKNLHFATVSRNRRTDSCERVHPPKAKCASHYSAVHSQISKCTFCYSGVRKNV